MKKLNPERLALLKQEYASLSQEYEQLSEKHRKEQNRLYESRNGKCPRCQGTKIIDNIKRIQGGLEGSFSGSSIFGTGSITGNIHGEIDTNEVLKCSSCGNEWKYLKQEYNYREKAMTDLIYYFYKYFEKKQNADGAKFDPEDLSETFSSLEEKQSSMLAKAKEVYQRPSILRNYHVQTVMQFLKNNSYQIQSFMKEILEYAPKFYEEWGCKTFSEELEEENITAKQKQQPQKEEKKSFLARLFRI
jgi:hypothetical protein